jgi:hypothetical protein
MHITIPPLPRTPSWRVPLLNTVTTLSLYKSICVFVLFICGSFNGAVSSSDYTASNDRVIDELERVWKEAVVT